MDKTDETAPQSVVTLAVDLELGPARLRTQLRVLDGPTRPERLLPLFRSVADAVIAQTVRRVQAHGETVSCQAGCAACCRYLVPIGRAEARRLHELVQALPPQRRDEVTAAFAAARERIEAGGLLEALRHPEQLGEEARGALGEAYFALNLACPFLTDGLCSIYAERPLLCREYLVVSPAALCAEQSAGQVRAVKLPVRPAVAAGQLDEGLGFDEGGWVALALALDWVASHPEPGAPQPGPALVQRFFAALSEDVPPSG